MRCAGRKRTPSATGSRTSRSSKPTPSNISAISSRAAIDAALRGYKDINLRAMRLLAPGGMLFTASCSFHVGKALFLEMLSAAAADSGRRLALRAITGQPIDHPEVLTIPETGYLKGAIVECLE